MCSDLFCYKYFYYVILLICNPEVSDWSGGGAKLNNMCESSGTYLFHRELPVVRFSGFHALERRKKAKKTTLPGLFQTPVVPFRFCFRLQSKALGYLPSVLFPLPEN